MDMCGARFNSHVQHTYFSTMLAWRPQAVRRTRAYKYQFQLGDPDGRTSVHVSLKTG